MTSVLFTESNSHYNRMECVTYDQVKDARTFPFNSVVIAHPPCRKWSKLRSFSTAPESEMDLGVFAITAARICGGVVEHPASSLLFPYMGCPLPGQLDSYGGFTIIVNLNWFGALVRKPTMLYIVGLSPRELPPHPYSLDAIERTVESRYRTANTSHRKKSIPKSSRSTTPLAMCQWLLQVSQVIADKNKNETDRRSQ